MKKIVPLAVVLFLLAGVAMAQTGVKKKRPLPHDYGRVVINNFSEKAKMAPVVFDHWLHRSRFTCRLCHVDIGFAMKTGGTEVRAADNEKGYYCGSCHNGRTVFGDKTVFQSCTEKAAAADMPRCERCHSLGRKVKKEHDFRAFADRMPKERFGNGINWEKAESDGLIRLIDHLPGISIKRQAMKVQEDFRLEPKVSGLPEIVFSHKKHTVWSGCEGCHPEIFVGVKKGATKYSMPEIFEGKYCGVCHGTVAFPLIDCQRCHTKPVQ